MSPRVHNNNNKSLCIYSNAEQYAISVLVVHHKWQVVNATLLRLNFLVKMRHMDSDTNTYT